MKPHAVVFPPIPPLKSAVGNCPVLPLFYKVRNSVGEEVSIFDIPLIEANVELEQAIAKAWAMPNQVGEILRDKEISREP